MKKSRFTEQQIAVALRQAEQGTQPAEICRKMGISETTFYGEAGLCISDLGDARLMHQTAQHGATRRNTAQLDAKENRVSTVAAIAASALLSRG